MMATQNFKYRIYPSAKQVKRLKQTLSDCRFVYNKLLEIKIEAYEKDGTSLSQYDLNGLAKDFDVKVYRQVLQNLGKRINDAFKHFFRRVREKKNGKNIEVGFPRFKSAKRYKSITYPQKGFKFKSERRLSVSKIGNIPIVLHRIPKGKIKTLTLKKTARGWFAIFTCENIPIGNIEAENGHVGIDVGIESFATLSDGTKIENPKLLIKSEKKLRRFQKALSRKKKGSNNRQKAVSKVAKLHEKISDQRQDFHHKTSLTIIKNFKIISVENLQINNMVKNHCLAKSISDAGWGQFIQMLSYKVEKTGGKVIKVNPRNTSKTCSQCGNIQDMPLSKRTFNCENCGLILDRDVNAAINIDTVGLTEIQACGDCVRPSLVKAVVNEAGTIRKHV